MDTDQRPSLGDVFYPNSLETSMANTLGVNMPRLQDHLSLTTEEMKALRQQHIGFFKGLVREQAAPRLHDLLTQHTIKPADDETMDAWRVAANRRVREKYGERADQVIEKAKELVTARPEFQQMLTDTGLANHPLLVEEIADAAWRELRRSR